MVLSLQEICPILNEINMLSVRINIQNVRIVVNLLYDGDELD